MGIRKAAPSTGWSPRQTGPAPPDRAHTPANPGKQLAFRPGLTHVSPMTNDSFRIEVDPHPLLRPAAFTTRFPVPLGGLPVPVWLTDLLSLEGEAPFPGAESPRMAVRDMLRHWGHKPAGRGKPASEYLVRAVDRGELGSINAAVDACNAVSLHSGFPIALVDLDRARPPFRVAPGAQEATVCLQRLRSGNVPQGPHLPQRRGGPLRQPGQGRPEDEDSRRDHPDPHRDLGRGGLRRPAGQQR